MSNNKGNKAEKKQEEIFHKVHVNCDTGILWKIHLNLWKYSLFYVEIFTCKYIEMKLYERNN